MNSSTGLSIGAVVLAVGIAAGGYLAGLGVLRARTNDRTVLVRGLSEREAKADLAIWPLRLIVADDDLARANATLERNVAQTRAFLVTQGLTGAESEVSLQEFSVQDNRANGYQAGSRYVIRQTLVVRSTKIELVQSASQRVPELVKEGVVLSSGQEYGGGGPTFVFTGLSELKPAMIAEATARAREGAEQFARDSRSTLTGIRRASQGLFQILPRDQAQGISEESQIIKQIRVVTTVEYGLAN